MGNSWTDRPGTACPCQRAARRTRRKRCGSTGARRKGSGTSASSSSAARRARAGLTVVTTARPSSPSTLRHLAWQERLALVGAAQVRWGVVPTQPIGSGPRGGGGAVRAVQCGGGRAHAPEVVATQVVQVGRHLASIKESAAKTLDKGRCGRVVGCQGGNEEGGRSRGNHDEVSERGAKGRVVVVVAAASKPLTPASSDRGEPSTISSRQQRTHPHPSNCSFSHAHNQHGQDHRPAAVVVQEGRQACSARGRDRLPLPAPERGHRRRA